MAISDTFGSWLKHGWNPFNRAPTTNLSYTGMGTSRRPDRPRMTRGNERSIISSLYNRIAIDTSMIDIRHCKLDDDGQFESVIKSTLNDCLSVEANIDQTGRAFILDAVISMLDEGYVALVPTETDKDPNITLTYQIKSLRVAKIIEWFPKHVMVRVYNEETGQNQDVKLPKSYVAIIENPMYTVMNESNSTLQRLIRKLNILDVIDEQSGSGKLDLLIQLPYAIKSQGRRNMANDRRNDIEDQLVNSSHGIAYIDSTEKVIQLNRSVDNNLMKQIEYLTAMLYSQLGMTQSILDGTADENTTLNYNNRTISPIITTIVEEMRRKFLTKTARTQGHSILFFRDPFKLVPISQMAEIVDKYSRNEVASPNEFRAIMGWKPSKDPKANELRNRNISAPKAEPTGVPIEQNKEEKEKVQNE